MTRWVATVLFSVGVMTSQQSPGQVIADAESYAAISAAISTAMGGDAQSYVTLLEETWPLTSCPKEEAVPREWRSVVRNHKEENARTRTLRLGADLGRPYILYNLADVRSLMRKAGYDLSKFAGENHPGYRVFGLLPGGKLIAVSAPGFDTTKTRAMVTVQFDCFPRAEDLEPYEQCNSFRQVMLEKRDGQWVRASGFQGCRGQA